MYRPETFAAIWAIALVAAVSSKTGLEVKQENTAEETFAIALREAPAGEDEVVLSSLELSFPKVYQSINDTDLTKVSIWNDEVSQKLAELELKINVVPPENLLVSAPVSVVLLGYLIVVGRKNSFKLEVPAENPAVFVKQTYFLPAALEMRTLAIEAFEHADTSMDMIRMQMSNVPRITAEISTIVAMGQPGEFATFLTPSFNTLNKIVAQCAKAASETAGKFERVQKYLRELFQIVSHTLSVSADMKHQIREQLLVQEQRHNNSVNLLKRMEADLTELKEDRKKQKEAYDKAVAAIPTGWEGVLMDFVRNLDLVALLKAAGNIAATITAPATAFATIGTGVADSLTKLLAQGQAEISTEDSTLASGASTLSSAIKTATDLLRQNSSDVDGFKGSLSTLAELVTSSIAKVKDNNPQKISLKSVISEAANLVSGFVGSKNSATVFPPLKVLQDKAEVIAKSITEKQPSVQSSRGIQKETSTPKETSAGNERYLAEQQKGLYLHLDERVKKHYEDVIAYTEKVNAELALITELAGKAEKHEDIVNATLKAIDALSQLEGQWTNLILFFQSFKLIVEVSMTSETSQFEESTQTLMAHAAKTAGQNSSTGPNPLVNFMKNKINKHGQRVHVVAAVIQSLANIYVDINRGYVVGALVEVGKLAGDRDKAVEELKAIAKNANAAMVKIQQLCKAEQAKMQADIMEQTKKLEQVAGQTGPLAENYKAILAKAKECAAKTEKDQVC